MKAMYAHPSLRIAMAAGMLAVVSHAVLAGPLRDRIAERRHVQQAQQAQQQNDVLEENEAGGKTAAVLPDSTRVVRDVAYGNDDEQRFDVYLPRQVGNAHTGAPVIFMVHGGGWKNGDKAERAVIENKVPYWTSRGYIFISTNYRLLPKAAPLEQAEDVARALSAAQRKAASWGGDASRFILMGHSAGAHLVALLNASPEKVQRAGAVPWLGAVLLDSATLDVVQAMEQRHMPLYDNAFGTDPLYWRRASPFHQLSAGAPPMLAVCSTRRNNACAQARHFQAGATAIGVRVQISEQDMSHREINLLLGDEGRYTSIVERFVSTLLRSPGR